jgi:hypothetical protein
MTADSTNTLRLPRVVIVHADEAVGAATVAAVVHAGLSPSATSSARRALAAFHPAMPAAPVAAVVDVGLHDPYVFQFVEAVRALTAAAPVYVVTVGSVHNPSRYRRRPTSLHGADAHVDFPAVDVDLPRLLAPLRSAAGSLPSRVQLADWALDHIDDVVAAAAAGRDLALIDGSAGASLAALRAGRARGNDDDFDGVLARMADALVAARAAGLPFG